MNDELDRLIKELGILRINIASMAARVESIQTALEQLKSQAADVAHEEPVAPMPEPAPEVPEESEVAEPELQPVADIPVEPEVDSAPEECGMDTDDADAIAESAEMEEEADADVDSTDDGSVEDVTVPTRELRQFLTINDRYRFRRELFGNSDTDMADTLNMIEAMASVAEVQDYVYSDLGWDSEIEEVQEFMDIVNRYFTER